MKKILLTILATLLFSIVAIADNSRAGNYVGKITYANMNGRDVTHRFNDEVVFKLVDKEKGIYALSSVLSFQAGPAYHEIDFSSEKITFKIDDSGKIIADRAGLGRISVKVLVAKVMSGDFAARITGTLINGHLEFSLDCDVINKNYNAKFDFKGYKK